ncbi:MAG: carbamoyltransferase C-terminal domain-containing protein [Kiloniellales bacterium]
MIVLGIHDGHCASACLMVDGRLVALAAEERFSRFKNDHGYPRQAIDYCLRAGGVTAQDLDEVAFASTNMGTFAVGLKALASFSGDDWRRMHRDYWKPRLYDGIKRPEVLEALWRERFQSADHFYDFSNIDGTYESLTSRDKSQAVRTDGVHRHLGLPPDRVRFYDHHACHAYYALFGSHIRADDTMVYTLDGGGDATTSTLFRFKGGRLEELARSNEVDVARIYREITLILGMKLGEHEFKVMGLAPYATDREFYKSRKVFEGMLDVEGDLISYVGGRRFPDLYFAVKEAFDGHRFDGIAAAVQDMCETSVQRWFEVVQRKYGSRHAVFAGGVAMNVKLNMLLAESSLLDDFYVCPSPTDDTLCVGACYMAATAGDPEAWQGLHPIENPYMGPAYGRTEIDRAISESCVSKTADVREAVDADAVAALLADGKVVARCSGRMEYGHRALGNRSILADPRREDTVEKINAQIKYRDFWMPFAPVILAERQDDYIARSNPRIQRPYMMIAAQTTEAGQNELPAAIHRADRTARPQVISRDQNPDYYDIIKAFERRTGTGALLNTSFNLHGEPIVCTPSDAISTFRRSALDVLLMEDVALIRRDLE